MAKKYRSIDDPPFEDAPEDKAPGIWVGPPYLIEEYTADYSAPKCQTCGHTYSYGDYRYHEMCRCEKREYWKSKAKEMAMFVGIFAGIAGFIYLVHRIF